MANQLFVVYMFIYVVLSGSNFFHYEATSPVTKRTGSFHSQLHVMRSIITAID